MIGNACWISSNKFEQCVQDAGNGKGLTLAMCDAGATYQHQVRDPGARWVEKPKN